MVGGAIANTCPEVIERGQGHRRALDTIVLGTGIPHERNERTDLPDAVRILVGGLVGAQRLVELTDGGAAGGASAAISE